MLQDEDGCRSFYGAHFDAVYRYFARRSPAADVADHVADVFLVAWRRFPEMPTSAHERTLWLYGVARRVLADGRKSRRRRARLVARMQETAVHRPPAPPRTAPGDPVDDGSRLSTALRAFSAPTVSDESPCHEALPPDPAAAGAYRGYAVYALGSVLLVETYRGMTCLAPDTGTLRATALFTAKEAPAWTPVAPIGGEVLAVEARGVTTPRSIILNVQVPAVCSR